MRKDAVLLIAALTLLLWGFVAHSLPEYAVAQLGRPLVTDLVASTSSDALYVATLHGVEIRHPESLDLISTIPDSTPAIKIALSPDESLLAVLVDADSEQLRIWDLSEGAFSKRTFYPVRQPTRMIFSPDGKWLAVHDIGSVHVWDTSTWAKFNPIYLPGSTMRTIVFAEDSSSLLLGGSDGSIHLVSLTTEDRIPDVVVEPDAHDPGDISAMAISSDETLLAVASKNGGIELWDAVSWTLLRTLEGSNRWAHMLMFSPEGSTLYSATTPNGAIGVWDVASGTLREEYMPTYQLSVNAMQLSSDGQLLIAATQEGRLFPISTSDGWPLHTDYTVNQPFSAGVVSLQFTDDGRYLAIGSDGGLSTWRVQGWERMDLPNLSFSATDTCIVEFSSDSSYLIYAASSAVFVSDIRNGKSLGRTLPHYYGISDVDLRPDDSVFVTTSTDRTAKIIDFDNGATLETLELGVGGRCAAYSADGQWLALGLADGTIRVYDADSYDVLLDRAPLPQPVNDLAFSPDGKLLLTCIDGRFIHLWDTQGWGLVDSFSVCCGANVRAIDFSSDGRYVALGNRIYDTSWWTEIAILEGHQDLVTTCDFGADGSYLATGSEDGVVIIWDFPAVVSNSSVLLVEVLADSSEVRVGEPVRFSAVCGNCSDEDLQVTWSFDDGTPEDHGMVVTHSFASAGSYSVSIQVTDSQGRVGIADTIIRVEEEP